MYSTSTQACYAVTIDITYGVLPELAAL